MKAPGGRGCPAVRVAAVPARVSRRTSRAGLALPRAPWLPGRSRSVRAVQGCARAPHVGRCAHGPGGGGVRARGVPGQEPLPGTEVRAARRLGQHGQPWRQGVVALAAHREECAGVSQRGPLLPGAPHCHPREESVQL